MLYDFNTSIFMQNFQEFYYEVLRQKERSLRLFEDDLAAEKTSHVEKEIQEIQKKLHTILEKHSLQASKNTSGITASYFRDAQYVMVALADEVFLNLEWSGASIWKKSLLERQVFQTQVAGEQFFKRLDVLLESNEPTRPDLAQIYLTALALGFKGQYNEQKDQEKIDKYREQLYLLLKGKRNELYFPGRPRLFDAPYDHTITEQPGRGLPDIKTWVSTFASVVVVYVFISYVVWHKLAFEMGDTLNEIYRQLQQSPLV
jgi:type VI secretion system protein ImpK